MKYYQQTIYGDEVLMDTDGRIYISKEYMIEYRSNDPQRVLDWDYSQIFTAYDVDELLIHIKNFTRDFPTEHPNQKIIAFRITDQTTGNVVKECKKVGDMKL